MRLLIFGAKSTALSIYHAIHTLYPDQNTVGFIVSSCRENPVKLAGLPVQEFIAISKKISNMEKHNICVLVGTQEDVHASIETILKREGFFNYILIDSVKLSILMERFYEKKHLFPSLHRLPVQEQQAKLSVYAAKCSIDKPLQYPPTFPEYIHTVFCGNEFQNRKIQNGTTDFNQESQFFDDTGDHISGKNRRYNELTALYWVWKNRMHMQDEYIGLCHYRRVLTLSEEDLRRIHGQNVDVVLQFPMLHEPDAQEHHTRYIEEKDWQAMLLALEELYPEYTEAFDRIFSEPYFYNHNLIIAKKEVLADYCAWLFPLLNRIEELSTPKGWERTDRYIAYISESLFTLYFRYHSELKIYHTGRQMYV